MHKIKISIMKINDLLVNTKWFILALVILFSGSLVNAQNCGLLFSEYIEGTSNNKAVEIYNNTGADIDLAPYKIYRYNNGSATPTDSLNLTGILVAGDVYVAGNPSAVVEIVSVSDTLHTITFFNGDDALALVDTTTGITLDVIGLIGNDPGTNWPVGTGATSEFTLVRNVSITEGSNDWSANVTEWDVYPQNTFIYIGSHTANSCCDTDYTTFTVSSCDSLVWIDGITYTENNNTATFTLTNTGGCDSIVSLDLTIKHSSLGVDTQTACDSYEWIDGLTYTESNNIATYTLTNSEMCDSVITLNLTITHSNSGIDTQTACDSYEWIDGITYTESNNIATFTLTNSELCDSVVTLNLTIYESPNSSVTQNLNTLTADFDGANYQWLDCNNALSPIDGETNRVFVATENGSYAVEIQSNGCTTISDCFNVTNVYSQNFETTKMISIFPNPTDGLIQIKSSEKLENAVIKIINVAGQEIDCAVIVSDYSAIIDFDEIPGIYFIKIVATEIEPLTIKIIKE